MKCQFIDKDDFFEEYFSARISEAEKRDFERHLGGCKPCSEKLAQQEKIITGIRAVGRAEMKAEIKQQAELASSKKFNWVAVTRIAALAFIFILTPTMYYVYKNQVQPESAPLAQRSIPPQLEEAELAEDIRSDSEFMDKLVSIPSEKETKSFQAETNSNIEPKKTTQANKSLAKSQSKPKTPELKVQLKRRIAKEDSKTEQPGVQDLDAATEVDAISREQTKFGAADDEQTALPENESIPARLNSISGVAADSKKRDSGISDNFFSSGFLKKDESNTFSKIISLNGSKVELRLIIEPGLEASPNVNWPDEFPVSVTKPDSNKIILKGKLPAIQNISNAGFSAKGISGNEIEIYFGKSATYRIKIDRAGSKAIRID